MAHVSFQVVINFLMQYKTGHPDADKAEIQAVAAKQFRLVKRRSVFEGPSFSFRFCQAAQVSFSNVVLSLSALREYDDKPFIVCVVRPIELEFLLANTTFLKKISHSSHRLREDNIRGSFLGHDIQRDHNGVLNTQSNFDKLFAFHQQVGWKKNLARLVRFTEAIAPTGKHLIFDSASVRHLLAAPLVAASLTGREDYQTVEAELDALITSNRAAILKAARVGNVNLRGNLIEQAISQMANFHNLHDVTRSLRDGVSLMVDIKTKRLNLKSSPKGYNIDKTLGLFARGKSAFSFYFVGLDIAKESISTKLVSVLDTNIIDATRIQFHWAGRDSRGVTQLTGDLSWVFDAGYVETIDVSKAKRFLKTLVGK
jgi:hypothetical protein